MFGISGFFKNIQNAFTKEVALRMNIKEVIKKHTGIEIPIENIKCNNGTVHLNKTSSVVLSSVYIKKNKILADFNALGIKVVDVR